MPPPFGLTSAGNAALLAVLLMQPHWISTPPAAAPLRDAVQVWRVRLGGCRLPSLLAGLPPEEVIRANAHRHEPARARFVAGRTGLRLLLGAQLALPPAAIRLTQLERGKPMLHLAHAADLEFNVSHSGELVLIALARRHAVGVDVETERPLPDARELARRFFAPAEADALARLPAAEQAPAFLRLWTRKEAMLKATGHGIADALAHTAELPGAWSVVEFSAAPGHPAAVAVRAQNVACTFHDLTPALAHNATGS